MPECRGLGENRYCLADPVAAEIPGFCAELANNFGNIVFKSDKPAEVRVYNKGVPDQFELRIEGPMGPEFKIDADTCISALNEVLHGCDKPGPNTVIHWKGTLPF